MQREGLLWCWGSLVFEFCGIVHLQVQEWIQNRLQVKKMCDGRYKVKLCYLFRNTIIIHGDVNRMTIAYSAKAGAVTHIYLVVYFLQSSVRMEVPRVARFPQ